MENKQKSGCGAGCISTPFIIYLVFKLIVAGTRAANMEMLQNEASAIPSNTPRVISTQRPTSTPKPTFTITATPAAVGETVSNEKYEVQVITVRTLNTVYISEYANWVPTEGNMFVEICLKVVNLDPGSKISVPWGKVYVIEEDGSSWYPNWGEFKSVASGVEVNPKSLAFKALEDRTERVIFDDTVFIRAIFAVAKHNPTTLIFGFGDSPLIEVIVP